MRTNASTVCIFFSKKRCEDHLKNSEGVPGLLCKFENQNLITLEDNYKSTGDFLFETYSDLELRLQPKVTLTRRMVTHIRYLFL